MVKAHKTIHIYKSKQLDVDALQVCSCWRLAVPVLLPGTARGHEPCGAPKASGSNL